MKQIINIAIAEDHTLLRQGLVALLKHNKSINILFESVNGKELLDKLKIARPHILLLDIEMPIMRAQDVLERINLKYPKLKVIIISGFYQEDYIVECFKLGVKAFLPKDDRIERVIEVIQSVHEAGTYTDPVIMKILADELHNSNKKPSELKLSAKEYEVLLLICEGKSRRVAAEALNVTLDTVNFHMSKIMRKTNTKNSSALVSFAIQNKLVTLK